MRYTIISPPKRVVGQDKTSAEESPTKRSEKRGLDVDALQSYIADFYTFSVLDEVRLTYLARLNWPK